MSLVLFSDEPRGIEIRTKDIVTNHPPRLNLTRKDFAKDFQISDAMKKKDSAGQNREIVTTLELYAEDTLSSMEQKTRAIGTR